MAAVDTTLQAQAGRPSWRLRLAGVAILPTAPSLVPGAADAPAKWFTPTTMHDAPVRLGAVLSPNLPVGAGRLRAGWLGRAALAAAAEQRAVAGRSSSGCYGRPPAYFVRASFAGRMLLTPEMPTHAPWVAVIQFLIAFLLIWRRTCILSGLGVLVLHVDAVHGFGMFHLTDYRFILCLALCLISLSLRSVMLSRLREPLLTGGLAFSLVWTAIEKFLYPQQTIAVVATHPSIGLGLRLRSSWWWPASSSSRWPSIWSPAAGCCVRAGSPMPRSSWRRCRPSAASTCSVTW